jgi:hypothetical protein
MQKPTEKRNDQRIISKPLPGVHLTVQGVVRELIDISDNGLGILIDAPMGFHLGQRIDDIHLKMADTTCRLQGAVAHITRTINGHVLGIRLKFHSIDEYRLIAELKQRCSGP